MTPRSTRARSLRRRSPAAGQAAQRFRRSRGRTCRSYTRGVWALQHGPSRAPATFVVPTALIRCRCAAPQLRFQVRMSTPEYIRRRDRFAALVLLLLIATLALALILRRSVFDDPQRGVQRIQLAHEAIDFDRFSARRERSAEGDRLSVSLRLRTVESTSACPATCTWCARNDQVAPKQWAIWPPQPPVRQSPRRTLPRRDAAHRIQATLSDQWERITATAEADDSAELRHRRDLHRRRRRPHPVVAPVPGLKRRGTACRAPVRLGRTGLGLVLSQAPRTFGRATRGRPARRPVPREVRSHQTFVEPSRLPPSWGGRCACRR